MAALNPDFLNADEVIVPDLNKMTGYGPRCAEADDLIDFEKRFLARQHEETPEIFQTTEQPPIDPRILKKWDDFQLSKGRYPGSADWTLLDEFCFALVLVWLPQIIGSCVMSNTFRAYVIRMMYQIFLQGRSQELLGKSEFGVNNLSFYCPFTYGYARRKANMRRGDGLYCGPMAWALGEGVITCDTPKLLEITRANGVNRDSDYPEPQSKSFYRAMGNWKYLDELSPFMGNRVLDGPEVTSASQLWDLLGECKPCYVCSDEAIHKVKTHPDGFAIHARNPRDVWYHNMGIHGRLVASDGARFFRWSNESWGLKHVYTREYDEVDRSIRSGRLTIRAIGEIDSNASSIPVILG